MAEPAKSSNAVVPFPDKRVRRRDHELAFLPAALEIVETPPSPIGRAIGATIIMVFVLALAWACFGTVDIVATASGKIIPSGRTKIIQPFEIGVVRAIHVHDGETVKAGDVLIELDPTMNEAEREHLQSDLIAAQLDVARLRAALADGADPLADFHPPAGASPALIESQRQFLISQTAEHHAKLAALDRQLAQKEAERATSAATIAKIDALIPLLQQQVDMRKTLFEHETGSKLLYLQTLQQLVEQQQERAVQKSKFNEADAAVAAIKETRAQTAAEYRRTLHDDLGKVEPKAAGLAQDVIKAEQRTKLQALTAPVDGVVQQLAVHTIGGVVTPAQPLLVLVPVDSHLEIEAMVSNRDIGFVEPGRRPRSKSTRSTSPDTACCTARCSASRRTRSARTICRTRPKTKVSRARRAQSRRPTTRARSTPRAFHSTAPRCRSRTRWSTWHPAWRSPPRSKPANAASSAICCHRCANTARRACASGDD